MKLKYQFYFQPVGNTYMGVAVGEGALECNALLELNEVGYDIVSMMQDEISADEVVTRMLEMYDTDRETMSGYVSQVVDYLIEQQVVE